MWGDRIKNKCITFFTDNEALVHVINKSTCQGRYLMTFVRKLVPVCLKHNILFKARHISGFKKNLADELSRFQILRSKKLAPGYMDAMPTIIPSHLLRANGHHELLTASSQKSSVPTYRRAWKLYEEFQLSIYNKSHISLPIMPATLALFVAYLFDNKYASSTVNTNVSALGYYHRLAGLRDPTKTFYIREMLKGYGKISHKLDTILPITLPILVRIMQASTSFCVSQYQSYTCMFKAMCSMAFFAFLRIGEITVSKQQSTSSNLLQLGQVSKRCCGSGNVVSLVITFTNYTHHYNQTPFSIVLTRQLKACPVQAFLD